MPIDSGINIIIFMLGLVTCFSNSTGTVISAVS